MKGKILKLRHLLTMAILVACLVGCGNQESTTTEPTTEVEEPTVTEKPTETVEPADESSSEEVEEESTTEEPQEDPTERTWMVDWETFAAQADKEEICLAISNETTGIQTVLFVYSDNPNCLYQYTEGDKVAVPIRDNIREVYYYTAKLDGTRDNNEYEDIYLKDENAENNPAYVEVEIEDEEQYIIKIIDDENNSYVFSLYK